MATKLPVTVVTGFLGAGKTSLIRHLLANARGRRLALVINEFGDTGVDGEILQACSTEVCGPGDIVELANGCLCCKVADDFIPTMEALLARDPAPDHIIIETSGLALPKPLIAAFNWPEIKPRLTVDGVITVADGPAIAAGQFAPDLGELQRQRANDPALDHALDHDSPLTELFEDQVMAADLVILNKQDQLDADATMAAETLIRQTVPRPVRIVRTQYGAVSPEILLGLGIGAEDDLAQRPSHHDGAGDDHDHDDFQSTVVPIPEIADPQRFLQALRTIAEAHGILRMKGFIAVRGKPMRLLVQAVGVRVQSYFDRSWTDKENRSGRLVVIGMQGFDQAAVTEAIEAAA